MKVINLEEAKANLEQYAAECQSAPVVVTVDGKAVFEMLPIRSDDADFVDQLLEQNEAFRRLVAERHQESLMRTVPIEAHLGAINGNTH